MKNVKKLGKRIYYSEAFKKARVAEYESGELTVLQISRLYKMSDVTLYQWIYRYSTVNKKGVKIVEESESSTQKVKQLEKRIAELERHLGQKQIKLDYYAEMIAMAKEKYNIDIEKNSDTPRSKK